MVTGVIDITSAIVIACQYLHSAQARAVRTALYGLILLYVPSVALYVVENTLQGGFDSHTLPPFSNYFHS